VHQRRAMGLVQFHQRQPDDQRGVVGGVVQHIHGGLLALAYRRTTGRGEARKRRFLPRWRTLAACRFRACAPDAMRLDRRVSPKQDPVPMENVILTVHLILALMLIGVVLLRRSEGGGLLSGGGAMSARGAANALT